MSEKTKILAKILSLYLITSLLFLGYFFKNSYSMKKDAIITSEVKNLKEIKMGIYMKARMDGLGSLDDLVRQKDVLACILAKNTDQIYASSPCPNPQNSVFLHSGKVGIFEPIQTMQTNDTDELSRANIVLIGKDVSGEILNLRIKTAINLCLWLALILLIAYYLAKLALAPLYAKITALNRFIKDSTHEINTPLSVILMSIETADKASLNERNLKRINNIELAAKSLNSVYEALVMLSFDTQNSKKEPIKFDELVRERLTYFAPFFIKRKLTLSQNLTPANINANRDELVKILDNLISNAIKYTNLGGEVSLDLSQNHFDIINSGEGLSKEQQNKIFERYTRFNNDAGGFGIGLALVKQCCKQNNITISCQSELGKETKFSLIWNHA